MSPAEQILLALRFYATGNFLITAGYFSSAHKSTVCRVVKNVSEAICGLRPQFIYMPQTPEEINECKQKFKNLRNFPICIGAIDCTHIKISSPGGERPEIFRNRHQYFSLNVQTICDSELKIRDIVARWPGGAHDAHIFRNSTIMQRFERRHFGNKRAWNNILVGDSGYPVKPYLVTPLLNPRTEAELRYNESQIRTRNPVERAYGVWKRRFPGLATGMRLKLATTQKVILATAILHNIALLEKEDDPPIDMMQEEAIELGNNNPPDARPGQLGANNITRNKLIYNYFSNL